MIICIYPYIRAYACVCLGKGSVTKGKISLCSERSTCGCRPYSICCAVRKEKKEQNVSRFDSCLTASSNDLLAKLVKGFYRDSRLIVKVMINIRLILSLLTEFRRKILVPIVTKINEKTKFQIQQMRPRRVRQIFRILVLISFQHQGHPHGDQHKTHSTNQATNLQCNSPLFATIRRKYVASQQDPRLRRSFFFFESRAFSECPGPILCPMRNVVGGPVSQESSAPWLSAVFADLITSYNGLMTTQPK